MHFTVFSTHWLIFLRVAQEHLSVAFVPPW